MRLRGPWQVLLFFAMLVLFGVGMDLRGGADGFELSLDLATTTSSAGQVFVSGKDGYSATRSKDFELRPDGQRHVYRLRFPDQPVPTRIRVDPGVGPGAVTLHAIGVDTTSGRDTITGDALSRRVVALNQLVATAGPGSSLSFTSTGSDPFLDFDVAVDDSAGSMLRVAAGVGMVLAAVLLGMFLCWRNRHLAGRIAAGMTPMQRWIAGVLLACLAMYALLKLFGLDCDRVACSPRGMGYGATLLMACVGFALVGTASLRVLGLRRPADGGLFVAILIGQVALVVYIYLRSLVSALVPALPLTRTELCVVALAAAWHVWRTNAPRAAQPWITTHGWLVLRLALLASLCIVVADREMPRLAMLSSDPDSHAFFARQLERLGGIYRTQREWGAEALGYPGGTAALIFAWASLSMRSVVNALSALPMLLAFLASLAVAETVAGRIASVRGRGIALVVAVAVTAAGLMFPVYMQFAHFEGTGRLLGIAPAALLVFVVFRVIGDKVQGGDPHGADNWRLAVVAAGAVFCLTVLNPVNAVSAGLVLGLAALAATARQRRPAWLLLAGPVAIAMLAMDPYYWSLMTGRSAANKLTLSGAFVHLGPHELLAGWRTSFAAPWGPRLVQFGQLMPWHTTYTFFACVAALSLGTAALRPYDGRAVLRWVMLGAAVMVGACVVAALLEPLQQDSRFYLLPSYFPLSMAMFKALVIVMLAANLVANGISQGLPRRNVILLALLAPCVVYVAVRPVQEMMLHSRHDYCGSMGCVQPSDVEVVTRLEEMVGKGQIPLRDGLLPRVLVPNRLVQAGHEAWVFPTGGSRYLAMADALPVAFFYFQGDEDYTTANYTRHVCQQLDRAWLAREGIRYVFLPAERAGACDNVFNPLLASDRVLIRSGDSMLIELTH